MGAFELPLLIIAWFVAICLIAPVILAVLVFIIGLVCSVLIKITDKYTDSDNLLDKVKSNTPLTKNKVSSVSNFNSHALSNALLKGEIMNYFEKNYTDKYPTFKDFDVVHKEFSDIFILKDKDGKVLGKEEIGLSDLIKMRKSAIQEAEQLC